MVDPVRRVTFDNVRLFCLFWFYTVGQALAGMALTHLFPPRISPASPRSRAPSPCSSSGWCIEDEEDGARFCMPLRLRPAAEPGFAGQ